MAALPFRDFPVRNRLLSALGASRLGTLLPDLETVRLERQSLLFGSAGSIDHVYFPENAVISLASNVDGERAAEPALVGHEGMAGLCVFLDGYTSAVEASVEVAGIARRMDAHVFRELARGPGALQVVMLAYTYAVMLETAQQTTCGEAHRLLERCAGWLLRMRARVDGSDFPMRPGSLSALLGVRDNGVALAMHSLEERRLIRCTRGHVEIVDEAGLALASCACNQVLSAHYARLLPEAA